MTDTATGRRTPTGDTTSPDAVTTTLHQFVDELTALAAAKPPETSPDETQPAQDLAPVRTPPSEQPDAAGSESSRDETRPPRPQPPTGQTKRPPRRTAKQIAQTARLVPDPHRRRHYQILATGPNGEDILIGHVEPATGPVANRPRGWHGRAAESTHPHDRRPTRELAAADTLHAWIARTTAPTRRTLTGPLPRRTPARGPRRLLPDRRPPAQAFRQFQ